MDMERMFKRRNMDVKGRSLTTLMVLFFILQFPDFSFQSPISLSAQVRMRDCIVRMPDSLMTLLTSVNRADCVDFREAGMEAKVTNRLGGTTELTQLTADYALWQYTSASQVEMKLLPLTDSTSVICLVRTVQLPAPDSRIAFYDEAWAPLPLSRFIQLASPEQHSEPVANHFLRLTLSPLSPSLQADYTVETYEPKDEDAELIPSTTVTHYDWAEGHFVPR